MPPPRYSYTQNSTQRILNPRLSIIFGKNTSLNQKEQPPFEICATSSKRRSTLTTSQSPTVGHLIYGIGFLYVISLVGDGTSLVTWSSSFSSLIPFIFCWLDEMPVASHGQPPKNKLSTHLLLHSPIPRGLDIFFYPCDTTLCVHALWTHTNPTPPLFLC